MPAHGQPTIRPLAAAALGTAIRAAEEGDRAAAIRALMDIDNESWAGIEARLARLGGTLDQLLGGNPKPAEPW